MVLQGLTPKEIPMGRDEAAALSPLALAYIGDAVYEILVRQAVLRPGVKVQRLHSRAVQWVSATGQERLWSQIEGDLTAEEQDVGRRARNAKGTVPQNADPAAYRKSTALEAVIGYLYLTGRTERIQTLVGSVLYKEK